MAAVRIRSLTTRFLLTLLLSAALPLVAFGWWVRLGMRERLEQRIVDVYLPELAQNAASRVLARLEQAARTASVLATAARSAFVGANELRRYEDLVSFTPDIHEVFQMVLLVDPDGHVVHTFQSQRLDSMTTASRRPLMPQRIEPSTPGTAWFDWAKESGGVWLDRHRSPLLYGGEDDQSRDPTDFSLGLGLAVPTIDGESGVLYALVGWSQVQHELEQTLRFLIDQAGFLSAQVFLSDSRGVVLAHTDRARYGTTLAPTSLLLEVQNHARGEASFVDDTGTERVAGFATIDDERGFHWKLGIHAASDELFATSTEFGRVLLVALLVIVLALVFWSRLAASAIARPIAVLARATETVARGDLTVRVPVGGAMELAELGRAFNKMAEDLTVSRDQLRHAERQAAWAEMARQVAHEIKNPLTPLRMSAQLVLRARRENDPRLPDLVDRLAKTVVEQTEALNRIASDFRQFAGPPERRLETLAADDLIDDAARSFAGVAAEGEIRIEFVKGASQRTAKVDRQELARVFLNLIQNALLASAAAKERSEQGLVRVVSRVEGDRYVVTVEDNGGGIPAEARNRLFEPYFTTRSSGTGLGLAICRRIVQSHQGTIQLESSQLGCTVFRFELPLQPEA